MTEAEWLAGDDPKRMVQFLHARVGDRKLRLFFVAVARSVWSKFEREDMRRAVEAGELHADGLLTQDELRQHNMYSYVTDPTPEQREWLGVIGSSADKWGLLKLALLCVFSARGFATLPRTPAYDDSLKITKQNQPPLLREVFGNPFRPVAFAPEWRTDTAVTLARQMYESRDFSAMPILADALQDAGCDNPDILDHCRDAAAVLGEPPAGSPTPPPVTHVRGCWVVDLVLGKA
jgi:hypothetical protein